MLRTLLIKDYALIEELEVDFDAGLNILTGETGAGKSIIIGAMKMILGERASTDLIRTGARKSVVEGVFDHVPSDGLDGILRENGIEVQPVLILRREISESQSRAFINDTPATLQVMRRVSDFLVDLHGQHEHQLLLRPETHLEVLDDFGGLSGLVGEYRSRYRRVEELRNELASLQKREAELAREKELIEFQIREIDGVDPQPGEEAELEQERRVLENAERLYEATARLHDALYESEAAVYDRLVAARRELEDLAGIDEAFSAILSEVQSAEIVVSEAAGFLQDYNAKVEFNPGRLEEIRQRLGDLELLKRKYGGSLDSVLQHRREIGHTYELARNFSGAIQSLAERISGAGRELSEAASRLSSARAALAADLQEKIVDELAGLGMPEARFEIRIEQHPNPDGWVTVQQDGAERHLTAFADGIDRVEFLITTNPGEELRPLSRVASGGEISRIMLGIKSILARNERLPILVFDEIDSGISGSMAQRVGTCMRNLAASHQIIAITHLPQIAARGTAHYVVEKRVDRGRTRTSIRRVDDEQRAREVAVLLSGSEVTGATLESARELMDREGLAS